MEHNFYPVIRVKGAKTHMIQMEKSGVEYLCFENLSKLDCIHHLFSTRLGGVSEDIFSSMNLSFTRGDKDECVRKNFEKIGDVLGVQPDQFVLSHQTHTDNIHVVTPSDAGNGLTKELPYSDIDGLITNCKGLVLSTFYADCVPVYLVDPVKEAIGLSHSGWKGTVLKIAKKTVDKMVEEYGSNPNDIYAAIAPSICQDCYEVSEDVIIEIDKAFPDNDFSYKKENGKYQLNLWRAVEAALLEAGVNKEKIEITDICTCHNPEYLFSHRASKGKRGNLGAFLMLK